MNLNLWGSIFCSFSSRFSRRWSETFQPGRGRSATAQERDSLASDGGEGGGGGFCGYVVRWRIDFLWVVIF